MQPSQPHSPPSSERFWDDGGLRGQSGGSSTGMTGFVLHTDTIEETCATLKARGVTLTQELTTEPWGKWAQFTDLDHNEFGIWAPAW